MDVIYAALISGGWAVVVAIVGFKYNKENLKAALESADRNAINALDADHAARLWEKKAKIYVDTLHALVARRDIRRSELARVQEQLANQEAVDKWLKTIPNPDWHDLEARLLAYAPETEQAIRETTEKDGAFWLLLGDIKDLDAGDSRPSLDDVANAAKAAFEADERLSKAVQSELHRKPSEEVAARQSRAINLRKNNGKKQQLSQTARAQVEEDQDPDN